MSTDRSAAFTSLQMQGVAKVDLRIDADDAAQRLSKAIRFKTVSNQDRSDFDEGAFTDFHAYLQETFPRLHATLRREVLGDPRAYSLLYTWTGQNPSLPPVVLMAHLDVVPVVPGTEDQWEHDAFSGDIGDGYVWGRGSLDDKVMVLAIMEAIEMRLAGGFQPTRTTYLAFGQDEEVGGPEGAQHIAKVLQERGVTEIALVIDEGLPVTAGLFPGISDPIALIGTTEKGYLTLELKVAGPGGHSAMPPVNSNIGILAQAITKVEASPFPFRVTQAVRDQMRYLGSELPESWHAMLAGVVFGDGQGSTADQQLIASMTSSPETRAMLHTTTAVTMVAGGVKENVLPPVATAMINFRILHGDTVESVTEDVRRIIGDDRVEVVPGPQAIDPPPVADAFGKEYGLIERSIRQTWDLPGLLVSPYLVIGGVDAKWFAPIAKNVYRFTAVRVESAADAARWHGVNERVLVSELPGTITFFHQLLGNVEEL
jgi:carboxypeptidase PM20D1